MLAGVGKQKRPSSTNISNIYIYEIMCLDLTLEFLEMCPLPFIFPFSGSQLGITLPTAGGVFVNVV